MKNSRPRASCENASAGVKIQSMRAVFAHVWMAVVRGGGRAAAAQCTARVSRSRSGLFWSRVFAAGMPPRLLTQASPWWFHISRSATAPAKQVLLDKGFGAALYVYPSLSLPANTSQIGNPRNLQDDSEA